MESGREMDREKRYREIYREREVNGGKKGETGEDAVGNRHLCMRFIYENELQSGIGIYPLFSCESPLPVLPLFFHPFLPFWCSF